MVAALSLFDAAQIAGSVTAILGCLLLLLRLLVKVPIVRRAQRWVRDGWAEDRAEQLDRVLAFNGHGSFRADMREFYLTVSVFMTESREDREQLRNELRELRNVASRGGDDG